MVDFLNCVNQYAVLIQALTLVVLTFTLVFVAWYTRETYFLRKAQENTLRILLETKNPYIIVTFEEGSNFTDILLVI
ncbi:MAG: hypothetical protein LH629_12635, partial [Ignavibacteria bacterium]|nr:hypothetical protein [Ignavibacteria bacterium]